MNNKMRPVHPGEILRDELITLGLSANSFATKLHVPANRITTILNGQRGISAETALRLAKFFGTKPEFWMNLQAAYDLKIAQQKLGKKIEQEISGKDVA